MEAMKAKSIIIGLGIAAGLVVLYGSFALLRADDRPPLSREHTTHISTTCEGAQVSLRQLHRSDASLRVNRGQLYEHIGGKLMARLNGRIALNQLDVGELVAITARYDQQLTNFRSSYKTYEETLSATLNMTCRERPEEFYYSVRTAREQRRAVYRDIAALNETMEQYHEEFGRFALGYGVTVGGYYD